MLERNVAVAAGWGLRGEQFDLITIFLTTDQTRWGRWDLGETVLRNFLLTDCMTSFPLLPLRSRMSKHTDICSALLAGSAIKLNYISGTIPVFTQLSIIKPK